MTTFPGGCSVTRLFSYADGSAPHLHTVSTESYVVIGGTGTLQTLDMSGYRETPLAEGSTIWFTPGTIHRAVNHGDLRVIVVMSNAGLPEAGDAVMTFPPSIVADPERYRNAARLPTVSTRPGGAQPGGTSPGETRSDGKRNGEARGGEIERAVDARRALALEGFQQLIDGGPEALAVFYEHATALVRPNVDAWRGIVAEIVRKQTERTTAVLDALEAGDGRHLRDAALFGAPQSETAGWGMCGRLRTHDVHDPKGL
ncbi:cupin domain-containing protein [Actinoplanes sp. NPDC051851]|uniref:cupin domain-containing protein n=1 Tax=Actinoplanes sp. NPDC051851 TaxID=3154753 RepID=UPI003431B7A9